MKFIRTIRAGALGLAITLGACAVGSLDQPLGPDIDDIVFAPVLGIDLAEFSQTGLGVYFRDDVEGEGDQVLPGRQVTLITQGWLPNGAEFQPSVELGPIQAGAGNFIFGFDDGITNMREGGIRWIIIPPEFGYGNTPPPGSGIPANSWLVFEIEVLDVQ